MGQTDRQTADGCKRPPVGSLHTSSISSSSNQSRTVITSEILCNDFLPDLAKRTDAIR